MDIEAKHQIDQTATQQVDVPRAIHHPQAVLQNRHSRHVHPHVLAATQEGYHRQDSSRQVDSANLPGHPNSARRAVRTAYCSPGRLRVGALRFGGWFDSAFLSASALSLSLLASSSLESPRSFICFFSRASRASTWSLRFPRSSCEALMLSSVVSRACRKAKS